ncbi:TonB-dependent receptor [Sphingobacterium shayense]|uniref:SusC/RagA family TonB-linked outer membrane protein n=1 Tax=Sphingobacterium shayense TaxID=626343 RepID=UPI001552AB2D|nr:TonB-dependent receptor [Sphingobacterium shayense]NQD69942.1 TonB-dependent receptor [Sphingobacterium shayense]
MINKLKILCLLLLFYQFAYAQQRTIKGSITDASMQPLAGVTVTAQGVTNQVVSNAQGFYEISVKQGLSNLSFSFIGYLPSTIGIPSSGLLDVILEQENSNLEEVVVIGYGTVKRKDLTGSVASITGKEVAAVPVANAAQALAGKLPGVNVTAQDGRPDADISIRVRGGGSISQSNEPLYIVDGFPVSSISDIPSNQIQSIDVLKDASSTAIYGARGANGVIIVSTKTGKSGQVRVNYDGYYQTNQPTKYLESLNAYEYIAYNWAYAKALSASYASAWERLWAIGDYAEEYNNTKGIGHYHNVAATNFSRQAYKASMSHSHNLSITGGNEKTKVLAAVNFIDNDGMKINSWFKRYNAALKIDQKLGKKVNLSLDTRYTNINQMSDESTTSSKGSILSSAYQFRPIATKDILGELDDTKNTQLGLYDLVLQDMYNPVERMGDYYPELSNRSIRANTSLSWNIIDGLTFRSELGLNTYWNRSQIWAGATYSNYLDASGNKTFAGDAQIATEEGWNLRWANVLNFQVQGLGEDHSLDLVVGQEIMDSDSKGISIWGNKFPSSFDSERAFAMMDQYHTGDNAINGGFASERGTPNRIESYFGRANYTLLNKYLFTATLRADGSSRFSSTHRWGYFPAAAFAWRLSDEGFIKNLKWVDNLKMRLSYGAVGNDGISANLWRMNWKSDGLIRYSVNEQQQVSYSPASATIANPDLKWETTITRNLGLDYSLLNNRLYGTIDLYKNSTKNLLMLTSISAISGFRQTYDNVGSTSNRGIELGVGGDIIRKSDFSLRANLNLNINRGRIDQLSEGVNGLYRSAWGSTTMRPSTGDYILEVGKPVGQVRGFIYDGWYNVTDFDYNGGIYTLKNGVADLASGIIGTVYGTTANKPGEQVAYPGVIRFKDTNGDGVVNEDDVTIIGDTNPKHTGGLNISGNYRQFDFALNFNWSYGNKVYNANLLSASQGGKEDGLYRNRLEYLSGSYRIYDIQNDQISAVTDPDALAALNVGATSYLPYHENGIVSSQGIEDGSFLRLNTVTLGYSLPESIVNRIGFRSARLYATIFNAMLFTRYSGLDPEVSTNLNQGNAAYPTTGLDWGAYPRARSFTFGLNLQL